MSQTFAEATFTEPGLWPTSVQRQLLRAALLDGEEALQAWQQWRSHIDLEDAFDYGSFRLLPLLYHNVRRLGVEDPIMQRLKGVYRMAWVQNQQLFHAMRPLLQSLHDHDISSILLKGAPLAVTAYSTPAIRPMSDIDVLVHAQDVRRTATVLASAGWQARSAAIEDDLRYDHSGQYRNAQGHEFDLHWHVMLETSRRQGDDSFWESAVPFEFEGVGTHRLDATHNLLHILVHGIRWNPEPPIRWIADAVTLLQAEGELVDWDRIVSFARETKTSCRLYLGVRYLRDTFAAPIPAEVQTALQRTGTTWLERLENTKVLANHHRVATLPGLVGLPWMAFATFCRLADRQTGQHRWSEFPHYLRYSLQLKRQRDVPLELVRRSCKRLRRLLTHDFKNAAASR